MRDGWATPGGHGRATTCGSPRQHWLLRRWRSPAPRPVRDGSRRTRRSTWRSARPRSASQWRSWRSGPLRSRGAPRGWGCGVAEPVVRAERFAYSYPDAGQSLHDVSLEIEPGTFTVLAGLSGSGKSTLLRAMCGLVPHFHGGEASGELAVGGLDVREHGPGELAAVCGTVFQEPETQVVMGGVRAELELPLEHRGEPPAALARAVEETALALGVGHLLERCTDTLSGGELQRVALAAAMVHGPELLLLDEPTSQLDPVAGDELVWLLRRLNEDWGTAVVVAEPRLARCLPAADRVIALAGGRVACDAPPREYLAWASEAMPALATPAARLFSLAGLPSRPASVKEARAGLSEAGIEARSQRDADGALAASRDGAAQLQAPR